MKKLTIYILFVLFVLPYTADAQRWKRYKYEFLGGLGTVNMFGDLGGGAGVARHNTLDFDVQGTRVAGFVGGRYKIKELVALKANVILAYANASDKYTTEPSRANRGVTTNTFFIEPSIQMEYSLIKERYGRRYTFSNIRRFNLSHVNTYVFVGLGGLVYFPNKSVLVDRGVGEPKNFALAFPMGIGFKYAINRAYTFGIELGNRFTTTNHLDGHEDIHSKANDSYLFVLFSVSKRLRTSRKGLPRF
jgi:hypothetical protein